MQLRFVRFHHTCHKGKKNSRFFIGYPIISLITDAKYYSLFGNLALFYSAKWILSAMFYGDYSNIIADSENHRIERYSLGTHFIDIKGDIWRGKIVVYKKQIVTPRQNCDGCRSFAFPCNRDKSVSYSIVSNTIQL